MKSSQAQASPNRNKHRGFISKDFSTAKFLSHSKSYSTSGVTRDLGGKAHHRLNLTDVGLVGRDRERQLIEQVYDRVCCRVQEASSEIVFIEGESGVGKSSLAKSVITECIQREDMGLFAEGKFDCHQTSATPYSAIVAATGDLCRVVANSCYAADVIEQLEAVLPAAEQRVPILSLVPQAQLLLRETRSSGEDDEFLDTSSSQRHPEDTPSSMSHFMKLYSSFLTGIAIVHPVILLLDDWQWADDASKQLLRAFTSSRESRNILVIAVGRHGTYSEMFEEPTEKIRSSARTTRIQLDPLSEECVCTIISVSTGRSKEDAKDIGNVVHKKTGGNAYFCLQFIDQLQTLELLTFSHHADRWEWDLERIVVQCDVAENVAVLLTEKIARLSTKMQTMLMLAACLGHSFSRRILETIILSSGILSSCQIPVSEHCESTEWTMGDFKHALETTITLGLLEQVNSDRFKFSHDRVQEVAFSIAPKGIDRNSLHCHLGELLLEMSSSSDEEDDVLFFSAVDLLTGKVSPNVAGTFLEPTELAELCLQAGRQAVSKFAFGLAAIYCDRGFKLLDHSTRWTTHYILCLQLRTLAARVNIAHGRHEAAGEAASDVILHAISPKDRFVANNVCIDILFATSGAAAAKKECIALLGQLEFSFPNKANACHITSDFFRVRRALRGRRAIVLCHLKRTQDATIVQACYLLMHIGLAAFHLNDPKSFLLFGLRTMRLTLEYSSNAFSAFSMVLAHFGMLEEAYEFGTLALSVQKTDGIKESLVLTNLAVHTFLSHLKEPLSSSLQGLQEGYETGIQVGQITFAARCVAVRVWYSFHESMTLNDLETQVRGYRDFLEECGSPMAILSLLLQLLLNLRGKSQNPLELSGEEIENEATFTVDQSKRDNVTLLFVRNARMVLTLLLDELDLAEVERRKKLPPMARSHFVCISNTFYCGMVCFAQARRSKGRRRRFFIRQARKYHREIHDFAKKGAVNCLPFDKLLWAESVSLKAREHQKHSLQAYREAIGAATKCSFRLCKGMAYERTGEYLLKTGGDVTEACRYLKSAWMEFEEFDAVVKLGQMTRKYAGICTFEQDGGV